MTVCELDDRYLKTKAGVRQSTKQGYATVQRVLAKEMFGKKAIKSIKTSDAKLFLIKLQQEDKKSYSSIHTIRGVLRPEFQIAVDNMFRAIIEDKETPKVEKVIDGYTVFLFYDENDMPLVAMHWQHRFNHMVGRYNDIYRVQMPNITSHVCSHTYLL